MGPDRKNRNLGKDVRDSGRVVHPIIHNRGKEPVIPDDVDTLVDDEVSSGSSLSLSLSPGKNAREITKAKSRKKPSHHAAFNDANSGASRKARKEVDQAPGNSPVLPAGMMPQMSFIHPAFDTGSIFYMPSTALIRRLDDMLSSPLGQHILDYEPPRGFVILAFATFNGSIDPYDHIAVSLFDATKEKH